MTVASDTAYHSFAGEVEARTPPRYAACFPSGRHQLLPIPPDRGCRRTEPYPCSGLCDADVLRASQPQHSVQHADSDGYLACLSPVRLEAQPVTDDALPSRDIALHQGAPIVSRRPLPAQAAAL